jgi:hypothetical protein
MFELNIPHLLTIKVGRGPTQARFRVSDPAAFREFLDGLFNQEPQTNAKEVKTTNRHE